MVRWSWIYHTVSNSTRRKIQAEGHILWRRRNIMVACSQWLDTSNCLWCDCHISQERNRISFPCASCRRADYSRYNSINFKRKLRFLKPWKIWMQYWPLIHEMQESGGRRTYLKSLINSVPREQTPMSLILTRSMVNPVTFILAQNRVQCHCTIA